MKNIIYLLILLFLPFSVVAQSVDKTIDVSVAGSLNTLLTATEKGTITNLVVTGNVDARDIKCIRDELTVLSVLNLKANIVAYTGADGTLFPEVVDYPDYEIPVNAFYNDSLLTKIYLSDKIDSIGDSAFYNCKSLSKVSIAAEVPPVCFPNTFLGVIQYNCTLEVPFGFSEIYPATQYWVDFGNIVEKGIRYVSVSSAGTLTTQLDAEDKATVIKLTVDGEIDARDIKCMRDSMPLLSLLDMGDAIIKSYTGTGGTNGSSNVVYPANQLPAFSFNFGTGGKTTLTNLRMPSTLTSIGQSAFKDCTGLAVSLTIPASVTSIGVYAFSGCNQLFNEPLILPANLTVINDGAFEQCKQIKGNLTIPSNVTEIKNSAFRFCSGLSGTLTIPNAVTTIGTYSFGNCKGFSKISVQRAVPPIIQANTFDSINKVTCILEVPIGASAIYKATDYWKDFSIIEKGLKNLDLSVPGSLSSLLTADEKLNTTNLTLSGSIDARDIKCMRDEMAKISILDIRNANIMAYDGIGGTVLISTSYPADEMPQNSFYLGGTSGRSTLTKVMLPLTLNSIGASAFGFCQNIVDSISIPDLVTTIGNNAFSNCRSFAGTLRIPNSVNTIGDFAYSNCTEITKILVDNIIPPVIFANTFQFIDKSKCELYIPNGSLAAYQNAEYWKEFTNIANINAVPTTFADNFLIQVVDKNIQIKNVENSHITCFDYSGKCIFNLQKSPQMTTITTPKSGVYIVCIDTQAIKLIVN